MLKFVIVELLPFIEKKIPLTHFKNQKAQ